MAPIPTSHSFLLALFLASSIMATASPAPSPGKTKKGRAAKNASGAASGDALANTHPTAPNLVPQLHPAQSSGEPSNSRVLAHVSGLPPELKNVSGRSKMASSQASGSPHPGPGGTVAASGASSSTSTQSKARKQHPYPARSSAPGSDHRASSVESSSTSAAHPPGARPAMHHPDPELPHEHMPSISDIKAHILSSAGSPSSSRNLHPSGSKAASAGHRSPTPSPPPSTTSAHTQPHSRSPSPSPTDRTGPSTSSDPSTLSNRQKKLDRRRSPSPGIAQRAIRASAALPPDVPGIPNPRFGNRLTYPTQTHSYEPGKRDLRPAWTPKGARDQRRIAGVILGQERALRGGRGEGQGLPHVESLIGFARKQMVSSELDDVIMAGSMSSQRVHPPRGR